MSTPEVDSDQQGALEDITLPSFSLGAITSAFYPAGTASGRLQVFRSEELLEFLRSGHLSSVTVYEGATQIGEYRALSPVGIETDSVVIDLEGLKELFTPQGDVFSDTAPNEQIRGAPIPSPVGNVHLFPPVLLDPVNLIYIVSNRPIMEIVNVYSNGVAFNSSDWEPWSSSGLYGFKLLVGSGKVITCDVKCNYEVTAYSGDALNGYGSFTSSGTPPPNWTTTTSGSNTSVSATSGVCAMLSIGMGTMEIKRPIASGRDYRLSIDILRPSTGGLTLSPLLISVEVIRSDSTRQIIVTPMLNDAAQTVTADFVSEGQSLVVKCETPSASSFFEGRVDNIVLEEGVIQEISDPSSLVRAALLDRTQLTSSDLFSPWPPITEFVSSECGIGSTSLTPIAQALQELLSPYGLSLDVDRLGKVGVVGGSTSAPKNIPNWAVIDTPDSILEGPESLTRALIGKANFQPYDLNTLSSTILPKETVERFSGLGQIRAKVATPENFGEACELVTSINDQDTLDDIAEASSVLSPILSIELSVLETFGTNLELGEAVTIDAYYGDTAFLVVSNVKRGTRHDIQLSERQ